MKYETAFDPPSESLTPIERGLHQFNLSHLGEEVIYDYHRVAIFAKDETGTVIGGVHGELCWDWLYIKSLWVEKKYRGQGVGTELVRLIEEAAVSRGFFGSHLETTDFQALGFYLAQGYEVFGELEGKPAGSTWYYLRKRLW
jgi:ribosomal protein S18 acetylase RimI-like enzyme